MGGDRPIRDYQQKYKLLIAEKKAERARKLNDECLVEPLAMPAAAPRDRDRATARPARAAPRRVCDGLAELQLEEFDA